MHTPTRFDIEVRFRCNHDTPCVIDHLSAGDQADSNRQLADVLAFEPADMVRRRRVRTADEPVEPGDVF